MHGANERRRGTVFVIKGATRGAAAAWKKVSLPSGSSVRHSAVSRMHVEPSILFSCHVILSRASHEHVYRYQVEPIGRLTRVPRSIGSCDAARPLDIRISIEPHVQIFEKILLTTHIQTVRGRECERKD